MDITEQSKTFAWGGFADIRTGRHMGRSIVDKSLRVTAQDELQKIRKVSIDVIFSTTWNAVSTIFQRFCKVALWNAVSHPNTLTKETQRVHGGHGKRTIWHYIGVDGSGKHHGIH